MKERFSESVKADFFAAVQRARQIIITGHVRPDGDCIGACLGLRRYLSRQVRSEEKEITVCLESVPKAYQLLADTELIQTAYPTEMKPDLLIVLDASSPDRLGEAQIFLETATESWCIDHHVSNTGFAQRTCVEPEASATCELLCSFLEEDQIDRETAEALYLGIVHDTGVFRHSCTTRQTMCAAGMLIEKGVNTERIIDQSFYEKTHVQNLVLGRCLVESILLLDGKIVVAGVSRKMQAFYGITAEDTSGVIDQLRLTKGVEVAIFLREEALQEYKVSMRSNGVVDVCRIAVFFGGGGHIRAAGCSMKGSFHDVVNNLTLDIEQQLKAHGVVEE